MWSHHMDMVFSPEKTVSVYYSDKVDKNILK